MNTVPLCSRDAIAMAEKLLSFHAGSDERIAIDAAARELVLLRNSAEASKQFKVLEVWGSSEGGTRFINPILGLPAPVRQWVRRLWSTQSYERDR
jgi:hypothetical protein